MLTKHADTCYHFFKFNTAVAANILMYLTPIATPTSVSNEQLSEKLFKCRLLYTVTSNNPVLCGNSLVQWKLIEVFRSFLYALYSYWYRCIIIIVN